MSLRAAIRCSAAGWIAPLSEAAADFLWQCLAAGDRTSCIAAAADVLAHDPPLTLWALAAANEIHGPGVEIASFSQVAERVLPTLPQHLVAAAAEPVEWDEDKLTRLQQRSVAASRLARNVASERGPDGQAAALLALVYREQDWCGATSCFGKTLPSSLVGECVALAWRQVESAPSTPSAVASDQAGTLPPWRLAPAQASQQLAAMAQRIVALEKVEHRFNEQLLIEKLESMRELADAMGHEINPVLTVISGRAQLLLREERDPERRRLLAVIHTQAMRIHEMIADAMQFARPAPAVVSRFDLAKIVTQAVADLSSRAEARSISLMFESPNAAVNVSADSVRLAILARQLIENALRAVSDGGRIEVRLAQVAQSTGAAWAELSVADNGRGLSERDRRHLFDPFYSGYEAGRGLGLGLSKCWRFVTDAQGTIDASSPAGGGTTFYVRLPIAAAAADSIECPPLSSEPSRSPGAAGPISAAPPSS